MRRLFLVVILSVFLSSGFAEALKKRGTDEEFSYSVLAGGSITLPVDTTFRFIPGFELSEGDFWVTFAIQDPLFRWASGDELSPCLVEKYELLNSNKSLFIKLREDIFWYDGTPITSADIEYSIEAWKNTESSPVYEALSDPRFGWFSVVDSKTVVFNFNDSYPEFLNSLRTGILAKHIYSDRLGIEPENLEESMKMDKPPIEASSGPFVLDPSSVKGNIILKRNPNWHGGSGDGLFPLVFESWPEKSLLDEVRLVEVAEPLDRIEMFEKGKLHLLFSEPDHNESLLNASASGKFKSGSLPDGTYHVVLINHRNGLLAEKGVRQALKMSIDYESLLKALPNSIGTFIPVDPRTAISKTLQAQIVDLPYDPEKAKIFLSNAGHPDSVTLSIKVYHGVENILLEELQKSWDKIGVKLEVERLDWGSLLRDIDEGDYELAYLRVQAFDYPEIAPWTSEYEYDLESGWEVGYVNQQIFRIMRRASIEPDWSSRTPYYLGSYRIWTNDVPVLVFAYNLSYAFWNSQLIGPVPGRGELYENLAEWYLQK
ncbi:MAG TPA: ABC transporter substrate-binding protein [Mesotoga infera]|uniref:ABC transporter substrate-binding protein n=1 Tax=Mesotoga infera TaxID=1236046 RepID=A0A7C1GU28_9BACT|nr:ABC transporter substrate-binding protein [Mesotoga infera]